MSLPILEETLPLLVERGGFATFIFGAGLTFFTLAAGLGLRVANAICSIPLVTALFGANPAAGLAAAGPCLAVGAIATVTASVTGGLLAFGASKGFTFEDDPVEIGPERRSTFEPIINNAFGIAHYYDAETHKLLNQTYGHMLDSHNATILSVTWIETLPTANHSGAPLEHLNMTHGRLITLHDNGVIRTAIGHTSMMGTILDSFNEFKGTNYSDATNPLTKRQVNTLAVNWMSYNSYGENFREANEFMSDLDVGQIGPAEQSNNFGFDTNFVQANTGEYSSKFCLGLSPSGNSAGENSIIVGEVYTNQFGGIDGQCDSG